MNSSDKLQIRGQGVIIFEISSYLKGAFRILNNDGSDGLHVEFTKDSILVNRVGALEPLIDAKNVKGLSPHDGVYYWVSLDSQNQTLLAGVGEPRLDTVAYSYKWNMADANREKNKLFLESLILLELEANIKILRILRDPVTGDLPLAVKDSSQLTMADVARGDILPSANLSSMAQKLYNCISGKNFVLNDSDFPDFSKAIEYSIATVGCWCNTRLKEKSREFNKDKPNVEETYLRITLGKNNGESPGVPYVMEIWPVGHYSPIHNHGGSEAIIRVLLGSIHVSLYPYLCGEPTGIPPFKEVSFSQGDITWISPTLNQTHQLKNLKQNTSTCITIQCYMYDEKNKAHYDYFDYIDDAGNKLQYEPDSDMEFLEFKEVIRREWNGRRRGWFC
jgi:hypothetical protein